MSTIEIVSPLPGTFYTQPSPDAPPYVTAGQRISAGQVVGLVEVMKQFSEITADVGGVVLRVEATSGEPVEPGQTLVVLQQAD